MNTTGSSTTTSQHETDWRANRSGISYDEYTSLVDRGVLADERVEYIYGEIVDMSPIGRPHHHGVNTLMKWFILALSDNYEVESQGPLLAPILGSRPEPDLMVYERNYFDSTSEAVPLLVVEVAYSSLEYDLSTKSSLYARLGVAEYWVIDIPDEKVHVFTDPSRESSYGDVAVHRRGADQAVSSPLGVTISLDALFDRISKR